MPLTPTDHNLGLKHLIEPGEDLSAVKVRENMERIRVATNTMVDSSIEPGAINTRPIDNGEPSVAHSDAYFKTIFHDASETDFALPNSTSYTEIWTVAFGGTTPSVPSAPMFVEIRLSVADQNVYSAAGPTGLDARYWFQAQVACPHSGSLALPMVRDSSSAGITQNPIRSITLSASDEPHDTGDAYSGYLERKQVVLAFPYVPSPVGPELTSLKVSVFTKTTNYAGTGAANASTAKILSSDITVRCIKR